MIEQEASLDYHHLPDAGLALPNCPNVDSSVFLS